MILTPSAQNALSWRRNMISRIVKSAFLVQQNYKVQIKKGNKNVRKIANISLKPLMTFYYIMILWTSVQNTDSK